MRALVLLGLAAATRTHPGGGAARHLANDHDEELHLTMEWMDENQDGFVTLQEVNDHRAVLVPELGVHIDDAEAWIREHDKDFDQKVSKDELFGTHGLTPPEELWRSNHTPEERNEALWR